MESRDKGSPRRCGSSQASALTWTTRLGGKAGLSARLEAAPRDRGSHSRSKSFSPLAHDLAWSIQACCDAIVRQTLGRQEGRSWRVSHHDMVTYIFSPAPPILAVALMTALSNMGSPSASPPPPPRGSIAKFRCQDLPSKYVIVFNNGST